MHLQDAPRRRAPRAGRARLLAPSLAVVLGVCCALLASCGSSGKGLIPSADAGPLRGDFEAVARAAESGNGKCSNTESAISKTEQDFAALPSSVNAELRHTLRQGIQNLRERALALCTQPLPGATTASTETTPTQTETTTTTPTQTETTPTQTETEPPPSTEPGGGTPAPGEEAVEQGAGAGGEGGR